MLALLAFAVTLLAAVLLSALAQRSVLSISVLFLVAGFVFGPAMLGWVPIHARDPMASRLTEIAMFAVLFADGMQVKLRDVRRHWKNPARALLIGMPLVILGMALLARLLTGLSWAQSFLLSAALSSTDPVLASALVGREEPPERLRRLLGLESGLNDGLALPLVIVMLGLAGPGQADLPKLLGEVALGVLVGALVPLGAILLERLPFFSAKEVYEPLSAVAIGLLVLAVSSLLHANEFLAAFTAGVMVATYGPHFRESFERLGEELAEILKLAALMVFGALISPRILTGAGPSDWLLALLILFVARPVTIALSFLGSELDRRERLVAGWFGPRGFASVFFALLIVRSEVPGATRLFHLLALVISLSIVLHSSTDFLVVRWFEKEERDKGEEEEGEEADGP